MGHRFHPDGFAKLEDPDRSSWQSPAVVVDLLELSGDETVVDFGAGTGVCTLPLAEALPRGRAIAVDVSDELLARLRDKLVAHPDLAARVETVLSMEDHVPLPDAVARALLMVDVWHEVADLPAILGEIARLVVPGGTLLIVDWAPMERPVGPPGHHVMSSDDARTVVASAGFEVTAVHDTGELFSYHYAILARRRANDT
jgi:ubiquinone/menaquinone biosynthesis C-methylase UbiE